MVDDTRGRPRELIFTRGTAIGPLLTSALAPLADEFGTPLQQFTFGLQGVLILCIGISGLFFNPLAVKIGKRPIYLFTTLGLALTCFWGGASTTFGSLVAARAVQGLMMAPFECLIPASIADVWFVHERGYRMALFNFGIVGGINLASPLGEARRTCLVYMSSVLPIC